MKVRILERNGKFIPQRLVGVFAFRMWINFGGNHGYVEFNTREAAEDFLEWHKKQRNPTERVVYEGKI